MEWLIAAQAGSSWWVNALLGGVGAAVGASATSVAALRTLSDTKKARRRTEEREATAVVSAACIQLRHEFPLGPDRIDRRSEHVYDWPEHAWSVLGDAEPAVLVFRDSGLRQRLAESFLLITEADLIPHWLRQLMDDDPVYVACRDVLGCLGANLRGESPPKASDDWERAVKWVRDNEREERARRWTSILQNWPLPEEKDKPDADESPESV
ncbi:hypothetical protein O1Q96_00215 (plasmid) [Streptomyces sp. Qhu-G9]|uniref:hypothetical protein n=1 Tax=Streptomyces sp. Qhu-G9 TaxID=3452799 RepID=UPI0022AC48FD|nr:hypothetical protein [Streptomyces aurantiacus]WAU78310.1 hypothetical protein O1Q96_00215 [Streptomyces aurantiacus]